MLPWEVFSSGAETYYFELNQAHIKGAPLNTLQVIVKLFREPVEEYGTYLKNRVRFEVKVFFYVILGIFSCKSCKLKISEEIFIKQISNLKITSLFS